MLFYPQLVAGPIERPQHMIHQLKEKHTFRYDSFADGLKLMAWGMCLKVVFADRLAGVVDPIFDRPTEYHGLALLAASVAFTCQIFLDFAGYSYIAIGAARTMGIELMTNFNAPFSAKSIAEFWRRSWHISLSTWFRDYLYIPLGGNRLGKLRHYAKSHDRLCGQRPLARRQLEFRALGSYSRRLFDSGARLRAVLTGVSQEFQYGIRLYRVVKIFALVCFAFIFFRAASFKDAMYIIGHMPVGLVDDIEISVYCAARHGRAVGERWFRDRFRRAGRDLARSLYPSALWRPRMADRRTVVAALRPVYFTVVYGTFLLALPSTGQFIYFQF